MDLTLLVLPLGRTRILSPLHTMPEAIVVSETRKSEIGAEDEVAPGGGGRPGCGHVSDGDVLQLLEEGGARVPGHGLGAFYNIISLEGSFHGDEAVSIALEAEALDEFEIFLFDGFKGLLLKLLEVHFVDGDDEVFDAEEGADEGVAAGLGHDAVAGVDENNGERWQVEAPVAMLQVYCSCPGVSAMMNLRLSVEK